MSILFLMIIVDVFPDYSLLIEQAVLSTDPISIFQSYANASQIRNSTDNGFILIIDYDVFYTWLFNCCDNIFNINLIVRWEGYASG